MTDRQEPSLDPETLRDPVLRRALDNAPDRALEPRHDVRRNIYRAAHAAVEAESAEAINLDESIWRIWWRRLAGGSGERVPWRSAFATLLVAGIVTLLWQREPVPDAGLDAERSARAPVPPAAAPAAPAVPAAASAQAPASPPPSAEAEPAAPTAEQAAGSGAPATADAAARGAEPPPQPATPAEPPSVSLPAPAASPGPLSPAEALVGLGQSRREAPIPGGQVPAELPADEVRQPQSNAKAAPATPPAAAPPAGTPAPMPPAPSAAAAPAAPHTLPAPAAPAPPAMAAAPAQRPAAPPSAPAPAAMPPAALAPPPGMPPSFGVPPPSLPAPAPPFAAAPQPDASLLPGATSERRGAGRTREDTAALQRSAPATRSEASDPPTFAALSQWRRITILRTDGASRNLGREELPELPALLGSAALVAVTAQPLPDAVEWRVVLERANGDRLASLDVAGNWVRWREPRAAPGTGAPSAGALAALREALREALER